MPIRDLSALFADRRGLTYPGVPSEAHPDGKTYVVPSVDAETGLWLQGFTEVTNKIRRGDEVSEAELESLKFDDEEEKSFYEQILGSALAEMREDKVDWTIIQELARDAFLFFSIGEDAANAELLAAVAVAGEALAASQEEESAPSTPPTPQSTDGSSSSPEFSATPDQTPELASTPSSKKTAPRKAAAKKTA